MRTSPRLGTGAILWLATCLVLVSQAPAAAAGKAWPRYATPEEAGFSADRLAEAESYWNGLNDAPISAFFVAFKGKALVEFGDTTRNYWCHSVRKSFLSALYGIHVEQGNIDLDSTMEELGIDDDPPLTAAERQARVIDLLRARSGVYHEAACEAPEMRDARPRRGSHPPGTFWYYNNWDFNALGTIFQQETGRGIFEEFRSRIGRRIGMQDFETGLCRYEWEWQYSIHPCYTFRMSARDRARFGQLFLQKGRWGKRQVVPEAWVEESTRSHSDTGEPGAGYGYMWWTFSQEFFAANTSDPRLHHLWGFAASGYRGQWIFILPDLEMVIATAVDVPAGGNLEGHEFGPLVEMVLTAREIVDLKVNRVKARQQIVTAGENLRLVAKTRNRSAEASQATTVDFSLAAAGDPEGEIRWIGEAPLPELAAGKRRAVRVTAAVPEDLEPGLYYLVAAVDQDKANYDLNRDNNLAISRQTIEVR